MALGARPRQVLRAVAAEAVLSSGAGIAAGLVAWWWLSAAFAHLSYGAAPGDSTTLLPSVTVMTCAAAVGVLVPAVRALHLPPWSALRAD